jgi:large subunit ribosomal protein L1
MWEAVFDAKAGKVEYRLDKTNIIHVPVGKASFETAALLENVTTLLEAIKKRNRWRQKDNISEVLPL